MQREAFLAVLEQCLLAVNVRRYYESELGFQGALLGLLSARLPQGVIPAEAIIEQEHQKRLASHGIAIRPHIILHEPFDPARHKDRDEANYVVMELKRRGSRA